MITDDQLLLYHYRDGLDPAERALIGAELAASPELSQRLQKLVHRLDAAAALPEVPVPEAVQQRWLAALDDAARHQTSVTTIATRTRFASSQWLAAAAVLLIALVVVLQFNRQSSPLSPPVASTATPAPQDNSAYERGLKSHLADTEQQLVSLESATPEERARLVRSIIEQNRIYALAADKAGEPQLARVLRAFTPVLESAASENTQNSAASVSQLAFELRVMQGRLAASTASPNPTTTL